MITDHHIGWKWLSAETMLTETIFFLILWYILAAICKWDIIRNCKLMVKDYTDANRWQKWKNLKNVLERFSAIKWPLLTVSWLVKWSIVLLLDLSVYVSVCLFIIYKWFHLSISWQPSRFLASNFIASTVYGWLGLGFQYNFSLSLFYHT